MPAITIVIARRWVTTSTSAAGPSPLKLIPASLVSLPLSLVRSRISAPATSNAMRCYTCERSATLSWVILSSFNKHWHEQTDRQTDRRRHWTVTLHYHCDTFTPPNRYLAIENRFNVGHFNVRHDSQVGLHLETAHPRGGGAICYAHTSRGI